jgi:ribosome-associated heat shock protein Hsp15
VTKARPAEPREAESADVRLDKWLWAARFYKTRALAVEEIDRGRVHVNGQPAKPGRSMRLGDRVVIRQPGTVREFEVTGLSGMRGPAPVARTLYQETPESQAATARAQEARRFGVEPAASQTEGRPTKRDRRELADWDRWSASLDE